MHALLLLANPEERRWIPDLTTRAGRGACRQYTAPREGALVRARERTVRPLAEQLALLDQQELALRRQLGHAVRARFWPLMTIEGVRTITPAAVIAELGARRPGLEEAKLAALAGVCPLEASSAGSVRHP